MINFTIIGRQREREKEKEVYVMSILLEKWIKGCVSVTKCVCSSQLRNIYNIRIRMSRINRQQNKAMIYTVQNR